MTDEPKAEVQYFFEVGCIILGPDGKVKSEEWEKTPIPESLARVLATPARIEEITKEALKDGNNS